MPDVITSFGLVHQARHGYSDGHRLLSTSVQLPRDAERTMLVLSDLSGQGMVAGFESYLTGYPLASAGLYAFARTWYAPEMPRPGCVWTHTLLVGLDELGSTQDPSVLLNFFRRPNPRSREAVYDRPLDARSALPHMDSRLTSQVDLAWIMHALYATDDGPVVVGTEGADECEPAFLAIWRQQWPSLRQTFTFCTGSLADRDLDRRPFDLQACPRDAARRLARHWPSNHRVYFGAPPTEPLEQWAVSSAAGLAGDIDDEFSEFLRGIGQGLPADRKLYGVLADMYFTVGGPSPAEMKADPVEFVGRRFPRRDEAAGLKSALLGRRDAPRRDVPPYWPEAEVLRALALTERYEAFDGATLRVRQRAADLWTRQNDAAEHLLQEVAHRRVVTPLGDEFLRGAADVVAGPRLRKLCDRDPASVLLVGKNPRLSLDPEIWHSSPHLQSEVLTRVSQNRDGLDTLLPDLVGVLLTAGNDQVASDFVRTMGAQSLAVVLDRFDAAEPPLPLLGPGWRSQLARNDRETLQWLESRQVVRGQTILLLTMALSPYGRATRDFGIPIWLRYLQACQQLGEQDYTRTMAFYLALALDGRSEDSVGAASASFDVLRPRASWMTAVGAF